MKKGIFYWKRKPINELDMQSLANCLKFCWGTIPEKLRRRMRKKLIKISKLACKHKYKDMWS